MYWWQVVGSAALLLNAEWQCKYHCVLTLTGGAVWKITTGNDGSGDVQGDNSYEVFYYMSNWFQQSFFRTLFAFIFVKFYNSLYICPSFGLQGCCFFADRMKGLNSVLVTHAIKQLLFCRSHFWEMPFMWRSLESMLYLHNLPICCMVNKKEGCYLSWKKCVFQFIMDKSGFASALITPGARIPFLMGPCRYVRFAFRWTPTNPDESCCLAVISLGQ